jgi:uncharacterized membrane protein
LQLLFFPLLLAAVMVAFPVELFAVTNPVWVTLAMAGLLEVHRNVLSSALLGETVAVNCKVALVYIVALLLLIPTDVTCTPITVTVQVALIPFAVLAVMVTVPVV